MNNSHEDILRTKISKKCRTKSFRLKRRFYENKCWICFVSTRVLDKLSNSIFSKTKVSMKNFILLFFTYNHFLVDWSVTGYPVYILYMHTDIRETFYIYRILVCLSEQAFFLEVLLLFSCWIKWFFTTYCK